MNAVSGAQEDSMHQQGQVRRICVAVIAISLLSGCHGSSIKKGYAYPDGDVTVSSLPNPTHRVAPAAPGTAVILSGLLYSHTPAHATHRAPYRRLSHPEIRIAPGTRIELPIARGYDRPPTSSRTDVVR